MNSLKLNTRKMHGMKFKVNQNSTRNYVVLYLGKFFNKLTIIKITSKSEIWLDIP